MPAAPPSRACAAGQLSLGGKTTKRLEQCLASAPPSGSKAASYNLNPSVLSVPLEPQNAETLRIFGAVIRFLGPLLTDADPRSPSPSLADPPRQTPQDGPMTGREAAVGDVPNLDI